MSDNRPAGRRVGAAALLALTLVGGLAGCRRAAEAEPPEIRPVQVLRTAESANGNTVSLTGNVQAQTEINQSFRIDGRLVSRSVDIGDAVRPGQRIAQLDPQNEQSGLLSIEAQLAAARARQVEARSSYARMRTLIAENAVSRAQYEQAEAALRQSDAQVDATRGQVDLARNRLSYTNLVSDVAGVVTARGPQPGEVVRAGQMIVQVARAGGRDAVFDVPVQIKNNAPRNRRITVELTGDPSVRALAEVREVAPRADPVTGTFAIRLRLINPPEAMRLGATVTGRMQLDRAIGIALPAAALMRSDGKTAVWVVDPKALTVAARPITIGSSDADTVRVAAGLTPGDIVVTAGVQALRPGQKVRLLESNS